MKVWVLSFVPFGCPAHDTYVVGLYRTKALAMKKIKAMVKEDNYDPEELCLEHMMVEG